METLSEFRQSFHDGVNAMKEGNFSDAMVKHSIDHFNLSGKNASAFIKRMPAKVRAHLHVDSLGRLQMDDNASMDVKTIVFLAIGIYVLAAVLPGALTAFFNASTTGWDTGTIALWTIIPLVVVVAVVLTYIKASD